MDVLDDHQLRLRCRELLDRLDDVLWFFEITEDTKLTLPEQSERTAHARVCG
jgi:hypothetical protein